MEKIKYESPRWYVECHKKLTRGPLATIQHIKSETRKTALIPLGVSYSKHICTVSVFLKYFHGPFQNLGPRGNSDHERNCERGSRNPLECGHMLLLGKECWEDRAKSPLSSLLWIHPEVCRAVHFRIIYITGKYTIKSPEETDGTS